MAGKNPFEEFIEQLPKLGDLEDRDAADVDEALAVWIQAHFPNGFEFDFNRRDLMIKIIKKTPKMIDLIMASKLRPYLDAVIDMKWKKICTEELLDSEKSRKKINEAAILMKFAREIFVLGYSLRSLEREAKKNKPANKKS